MNSAQKHMHRFHKMTPTLPLPLFLQDEVGYKYVIGTVIGLCFLLIVRHLRKNPRQSASNESLTSMIHSIGTHVPSHIATADYFLKVVSTNQRNE